MTKSSIEGIRDPRLFARDIDLEDIARNLAGIDEDWIRNANPLLLQRTLREMRDQARAVLDRLARSR